MSQPSDPAWVAPDSAGSAPAPGSGVAPEPDGQNDASRASALFEGPAPVLVSFAPSAKQNRLTIAFRLLLAIPHLIILYALGIAAEFVAIIGWFAALFTGSLPDWAHTFITGVVRWQIRAYAYAFFLTGSYPPFSLEDESYPVRLVTARARLNRFAVFFRLILVIPALIVAVVAVYGLAVVSFFCWLIALVAGRLPESLHQAMAAVLRFQARFSSYFCLVTGVYPWWGLFGDHVPVPAMTSGPAADADTTPAAATDPWRLPLSAAARGLVTLFLVIGVAAWIVIGFLGSSASNPGSAFSNAESLVLIGEAYNKVASSSTNFEKAVQACGSLSCVTAQDSDEATALRAFASSVSSARVTGPASADANRLENDANAAAQSLDKLAASTTVAQYQSEVSATGLQQQLNSLDADYTKLIKDLSA